MNLFDLTRKAGKQFLNNSAHREIFHVHTYRCRHAANVADEMYILKAIDLGAVSITFTDHAPFPGNPFGNRMDIQQLSEYLDSLVTIHSRFFGTSKKSGWTVIVCPLFWSIDILC